MYVYVQVGKNSYIILLVNLHIQQSKFAYVIFVHMYVYTCVCMYVQCVVKVTRTDINSIPYVLVVPNIILSMEVLLIRNEYIVS